MTLFNRPGRTRVLWALLLSGALLGVTFFGLDRSISSAQQASNTTTGSTDTTAPSDSTDTTAADSTDTTGSTVDVTSTTQADANDPNGNIHNLPIHNGTQKGNVFNPVPYGEIPANTPMVLIERPGSGRILPLNTEIRVRARVQNFQPGFFNDPATQYGLEAQRLNDQGNLQGHNHACITRIPANGVLAAKCDSFVVLQQEATSNVVSNVAPPLTVPGRYRICVDDASGAHYVAARAFAQQSGPVDCVRVLVMRLGRH